MDGVAPGVHNLVTWSTEVKDCPECAINLIEKNIY